MKQLLENSIFIQIVCKHNFYSKVTHGNAVKKENGRFSLTFDSLYKMTRNITLRTRQELVVGTRTIIY